MNTELVISYFESLRIHQLLEKRGHQAKVSLRVIDVIKKQGPTVTLESLSKTKGIGKSSIAKIEAVLGGGWPDCPISADQGRLITELENAYAIGPVSARTLVLDKGIKSIADLRRRCKEEKLLNAKQEIGIQYFEALKQRIPRAEVSAHAEFIKQKLEKISSKTTMEVVGSYRRQAADSGDIDVLLTGDDPGVLPQLLKHLTGYMVATLAGGKKKDIKFMGIAMLPEGVPRRIDILYCPPDEYCFALLYFTGSKEYNTMLRAKANQLGYTLNEHALTELETGATKLFSSERSVVEFLQEEWREPSDR